MKHGSKALDEFLDQLRGTDAAAIASGAVAAWRRVDAALIPIIGARGVDALYRRSLYLARTVHPWLPSSAGSSGALNAYGTLQAVLAVRSSEQALAGYTAVLHGFYELLATLIGEALTERLLRSVWNPPSSGDAVQETTS